MEEDRTYIAKKCAEVRGQFDHVMKMARDALALCYICEGIRQLQCLLQQHRFVYTCFVNVNYWTVIDTE